MRNRCCFPPLLVGLAGLLSCEATRPPETLLPAPLRGTWRQDSARGSYYTPRHELVRNLANGSRLKGQLTITATRWVYRRNGVMVQHRFTWFAGKLLVQQYPVGEENGRVDTLDILRLDAHRLLLRDSSNRYLDGSINVWRTYYAR